MFNKIINTALFVLFIKHPPTLQHPTAHFPGTPGQHFGDDPQICAANTKTARLTGYNVATTLLLDICHTVLLIYDMVMVASGRW